MYLEAVPTGLGVVVVGLNPAPAEPAEMRFYLQKGATYSNTVAFLQANLANIKYYKRLKPFVQGLGFRGPIHWTEVAKCEVKKGVRSPGPQMLTNCARAYLSRELSALPGWPVLAVGRTAFNALSFMGSGRAVIGIPHPTGAWGRAFTSLCGKGTFSASQQTARRVKSVIKVQGAHWLV